MTRWQYFEDAELLSNFLCEEMLRLAAAKRPHPFRVALAGGNTPLRLYQCLADSRVDLSHWHLFYGDERCLPSQHPERNSHLVASTGLSDRCGAHYPIPAELGPEQAAKQYEAQLQDIGAFDLVLLGIGEDGHTASLFPGQQTLWLNHQVVAINDSPKAPAERVSLSPERLQNSTNLWVLVTGANKATAVQRWKDGEALPVATVARAEHARVFCERAAAR